MFTWMVLALIVFGLFIAWQASREAEDGYRKRARAAEEKIAAMTPEQKAKQAAASDKAAAESKRQDAAVNRAALGARLLKKAMNNPDKFQLESAMVVDSTSAVCYEYRGQNAFGAIVKGRAVLSRNGKQFLMNTDSGFTALWNSECGGKTGQEVGTAIRWLAL